MKNLKIYQVYEGWLDDYSNQRWVLKGTFREYDRAIGFCSFIINDPTVVRDNLEKEESKDGSIYWWERDWDTNCVCKLEVVDVL